MNLDVNERLVSEMGSLVASGDCSSRALKPLLAHARQFVSQVRKESEFIGRSGKNSNRCLDADGELVEWREVLEWADVAVAFIERAKYQTGLLNTIKVVPHRLRELRRSIESSRLSSASASWDECKSELLAVLEVSQSSRVVARRAYESDERAEIISQLQSDAYAARAREESLIGEMAKLLVAFRSHAVDAQSSSVFRELSHKYENEIMEFEEDLLTAPPYFDDDHEDKS